MMYVCCIISYCENFTHYRSKLRTIPDKNITIRAWLADSWKILAQFSFLIHVQDATHVPYVLIKLGPHKRKFQIASIAPREFI